MAITFGSVVKATCVGAAVFTVATIAPIGVFTVWALTAAAAGTNLGVDSVMGEKKKLPFEQEPE